jgi:hypothetical protein
MSFDKLPKETLDQICEEVGKFEDDGAFSRPCSRLSCRLTLPTADAVKTLLSLSLTCLSAVSPACRELYREPFRAKSVRKVPRAADALFRTLYSRPHLAKLVFDLSGLAAATKDYWQKGKGWSIGGVGNALAWQNKVVEVCPSLQQAHLYLYDVAITRAIPTLLAKLPRLKLLGIHLDGHETRVEILFSTWNKAYNAASPPSCKSLLVELESIAHQTPSPRLLDHPLPPTVDNLFLILDQETASFAPALLETSLSHLTGLAVQCSEDFEYTSLAFLFVGAGSSRLRRFVFEGNALQESFMASDWDDYDDSRLELPEIAFSSFPVAKHLSFTWTTGMNIEKLSLLGDSSPNLISLDLTGTLWDYDPDKFDAAAVESQLLDVLRRRVATPRRSPPHASPGEGRTRDFSRR